MPAWLRSVIPWLVGVLVVALVLYALTLLVGPIKDVAAGLAAGWGTSKAWYFVAGLAAPIVWVFRSVGDWLKELVGGFATSAAEKRIAADTERIDRELADVRAKVEGIDRDWKRVLDTHDAAIAESDRRLAELDADRRAVREAIAEAEAKLPAPPAADEDVFDWLRRRPGVVDTRAAAGGR